MKCRLRPVAGYPTTSFGKMVPLKPLPQLATIGECQQVLYLHMLLHIFMLFLTALFQISMSSHRESLTERTCHSPSRQGYTPPICRQCASAAWRWSILQWGHRACKPTAHRHGYCRMSCHWWSFPYSELSRYFLHWACHSGHYPQPTPFKIFPSEVPSRLPPETWPRASPYSLVCMLFYSNFFKPICWIL